MSEQRQQQSGALKPSDSRRGAGNGGGLGTKVFDFLKGTPWLGRPLHPMLTYAPIGAWTTATVLDLTGPERGADRAVKLGVFTALPTMVTGCIDWYDTTGQERRVGMVHMVMTCAGTMIYMQSMRARFHGQRELGVGLSAAGLATILVGSWIGTDLVVKYGMGIIPVEQGSEPQGRREDRNERQNRGGLGMACGRTKPNDQQMQQDTQGSDQQTQPQGMMGPGMMTGGGQQMQPQGMSGMCPMCGRMMGGGQQMQPQGMQGSGQQMQPQSMQDPTEIRRQIQGLQQRLDEIERVQQLEQQVQQLQERLRTLEGRDQGQAVDEK
jgi:uncharacterized membrane protein